MSQAQLILTLNEVAEPGDTVIAAAGTPPGDLLKIWDATGGKSCHLEFGFSCMGYELPAGRRRAHGAARGRGLRLHRGRHVPAEPGELVTAFQERLKVTVVISENHGYQSIQRLQLWRHGKMFGNEFRARRTGRLEGDYIRLDLAKAAEGLGARTWGSTRLAGCAARSRPRAASPAPA